MSRQPSLVVEVSGAMSRCPALHITAAVSRVTSHDITADEVVTGCVHRVDAGARDGKVMQVCILGSHHTAAQPPPPPPATTCFTRASTALNPQYVSSIIALNYCYLLLQHFAKVDSR